MNILVWDIETLKRMFLVIVYNPQENKTYQFEVSNKYNQLEALARFIDEYQEYYWVSYNGIRFDHQVVEWILHNYERWVDKGWEEICELIYQKAQDVIDDSNYDVFPEYREENFSMLAIDLFTIWHFNNENRRTSLKAVEFAIDFENIEEMPIPHDKSELTNDELQLIRDYCKNDVMATYSLYKITRGDTTIEIFKGKDKIADRFIMKEEFGLRCLNWDDVKIGAEWNKLDYMDMTKKKEHELKPRKINHFFGKRFRQFFPKTVTFKTPEVRAFVRNLGNTFVLNKFQEFKYKFNNELTVTIAKGGIHSNEKGRFLKPKSNEIYWQIDIGSQYPNAIRKYKIEPEHLPGWNKLIVKKIERRLNYKHLYKETGNPKYNSLQEMGKLALNGGSYGRLNTKGDWQEDPMCMLKVTMGGQLEILMIIETLVLKGFKVVSVNTDGFDVIVSRERNEELQSILTEFEKIIGNDTLGNFEYTEFQWIAQTSVNDYIALKKDGSIKSKGDFEVDKELHKNKSGRIIPIALREWFVNGTPVVQTIRHHDCIYDFCLRQKASRFFHYEGIRDGKVTIYNKLIRYYVSNSGEKIYKIKNPECTTNAPPKSQIEAGDWVCNVVNFLPKGTSVKGMNINYDFYVEKAEAIIAKVDKTYKKTKKENDQQLSLW